jgi:hypothetical protein
LQNSVKIRRSIALSDTPSAFNSFLNTLQSSTISKLAQNNCSSIIAMVLYLLDMASSLRNCLAHTKPPCHTLTEDNKWSLLQVLKHCDRNRMFRTYKSTFSPFLPTWLNRMDTSSVVKYLEQNVKASLATYASPMYPSDLVCFLTKRFNVHSLLMTGHIHPYYTGPLRIASSDKWTTKWTITSNTGGKIFSSLHKLLGYLF